MQNHCCKAGNYDREVRAYYRDNGIVYQGFGCSGRSLGRFGPRIRDRSENVHRRLLRVWLRHERPEKDFVCLMNLEVLHIYVKENLKAVEISQRGNQGQQSANVRRFKL